MIHPTVTFTSSAHAEAHLYDAHGRQVFPGEDAARAGLSGLKALHDGAHADPHDGYGYSHTHGAPERGSESFGMKSAETLDRLIAGALLMAYEMESDPGSVEDLVRNRIVAIHDAVDTDDDRDVTRAALRRRVGAGGLWVPV